MLIKGRVYCPMIKVDCLTAGVLLRELAHRLQILPASNIIRQPALALTGRKRFISMKNLRITYKKILKPPATLI